MTPPDTRRAPAEALHRSPEAASDAHTQRAADRLDVVPPAAPLRSALPTTRRALALLLATPALARAQEAYPNRPLRLVVGFPPGTAADLTARLSVPMLSEQLGQPIVIENRPGAGSGIAAEAVTRAAPDGYTLLLASAANVIGQLMQPNATYDMKRDFAPIATLTDLPNILVVHPSLGVHSVRELIAHAKARPDQVFYGSSGIATAPHLSGELFNQMAGVRMVHVPYAGSGQAMTDLLEGRVQAMFSPAPTARPQIESGKLLALATSGAERTQLFPGLPTVAESGLPGFDTSIWFGLMAPAATPAPVLRRLAEATAAVTATPAIRARFHEQGMDPLAKGPAEFAALVAAELTKWAAVVAAAGAR